MAIVLVATLATGCGSSPGKTTCGEFLKMTDEGRIDRVHQWEPSLEAASVKAKVDFLYEACATTNRSNWSDRLEDIAP
jgi:hypothetical protein